MYFFYLKKWSNNWIFKRLRDIFIFFWTYIWLKYKSSQQMLANTAVRAGHDSLGLVETKTILRPRSFFTTFFPSCFLRRDQVKLFRSQMRSPLSTSLSSSVLRFTIFTGKLTNVCFFICEAFCLREIHFLGILCNLSYC